MRVLTAALILMPTALLAQDLEQTVTAFLAEHGFSDIELVRHSGTLTASAEGEGRVIEIVYNAATGEIISQELSMLDPDAVQ